MSESKTKRRKHAAILEASPYCIYCGGLTPATTIEHMPPIGMFTGRRRPKGLEFPACKPCNNGSSRADLVASLVGRMYPDTETSEEQKELECILKSVSTNIPGLLEEMNITSANEEFHLRRLPFHFDGGILHAGGPIMTAHMQAFALKVGLALHQEVVGKPIPPEGGVMARWFSNYDRVTGDFPTSVYDHLMPLATLKQGKREVSDQFQYSWRVSEDNSFGMYYAEFRMSFAMVAFAALDRAMLEVPGRVPRAFSPLEVGRVLSGEVRMS